MKGASAFAAIRLGAAIALARAFAAVRSAAVWFFLFGLVGAVLLVAGVFVLAGLGASMVAGGAVCLIASALLLIGLTRGG